MPAIHASARIVNRLFGRHLLNTALLVGIVVAFAGTLSGSTELTEDPDLWWHLANARTLCSTHHFIRYEPYSFTVHGERWIDPEWLSELPYWLGYSLSGLLGIHIVALIALSANLLCVYFRSCSRSGHEGAAFWIAVLGSFLLTINAGARTILIGYLAMSAEMAILDAAENGKTRLLWLLPPLFCLWINLHGSWVIGLGLLGLYIACGLVPVNLRFVAQDAFARPVRNRLVLVFFLSLASLLVNPYGWRLLWNPFDMLANQKLMIAITDEWQPLNFRSSVGIAAVIFLALMIVSNCVRWRKWKVYEFAFVLFAWYYAFAHQRFAFMACVLTAPWLAGDVARSFFRKRSEKTIPALNALFAAAVACAVVFLLPSEVELERALAARYPFQSIARIQPSWRTFNDYGLGGMLDFNFKPSFIDSRNDTFEHHGVLQAFLAIENLNNPLKLLDQYRIDHVLIRTGSPLAGVLEHSPAWQIELREGAGGNQYELLAKSGGPTTNKSQ